MGRKLQIIEDRINHDDEFLSENTNLKESCEKKKRIRYFKRGKLGEKIRPLREWFEDIDEDEVEDVEVDELDGIDDDDDYIGIVNLQENDAYFDLLDEQKREDFQGVLDGTDKTKHFSLSEIPAGVVLILDTPYRDEQEIEDGDPDSKIRPNIVAPRGFYRNKVALLQVTTSAPRVNDKDGQKYDVKVENVGNPKVSGLKKPSTVRCSELWILPENYSIDRCDISGALYNDDITSVFWEEIVKKCQKVPFSSISRYGDKNRNRNERLNCSINSNSNVIAYVVMPCKYIKGLANY